jgi:predicted AlkP superfamily phosphohydrolase/phosphomutase
MEAGATRVAAIGLDAAEWSLVEQLLDEGELPHLAALRERSAFARLEDPVDYRTGLVWEHFLTGRSAAGNERWAAVEFDPATYDVWQEGSRPTPPFYTADPPMRAVVFDVPYAPLVHRVDGSVVVGWGGHDPGYPRASTPPGLVDAIDSRFGPHPAFANDYTPVWHDAGSIDALCDALVVGSRRRIDAALWLLRQQPSWELFVTVLSEPHSAGEQLWHGIDPLHPLAEVPTAELARRRLREVYRATDDAVGRLVAALPDDVTFVVFSMHGMGTNDADVASMVLLPEFLHRLQHGRPLLFDPDAPAWEADGHEPVIPDIGWSPFISRSVRDLRPFARRLRSAIGARVRRPSSPKPKGRVGALGRPIPLETHETPESIGVPHSSVDWQLALRYRRWWPGMTSFALPTFYDGRIRLNVRGRERDGMIDPKDYTATCDEIERELLACRDPRRDAPLVARVDRLRAADPFGAGGPDADLQVVWSGPADALVHPTVGRIGPYPFRRTGGHSANGFAFVAGPGVTPGDLGSRSAMDVTPTVLHLLGHIPPGAIEGRSLL